MSRRYLSDNLIKKGLMVITSLSVILIILMLIFMLIEAVPAFYENGVLNFVFGLNWSADNGQFGIFPMIAGSVYVTLIALVLAVPISISCAIFLEEIAPANLKNLFKPIIQTLAGIPSVIYGFFGLTLIVPIIRNTFGGSGFSILAAAIVLALMILPTIISLTQDAINSVPKHYREASWGLGSNQWQCIKNIVVPVALPGIVTAIILGLGRAIGETLAVLMLAGNVSVFPTSITSPVRTLTSNIALEMGYATGIHYNSLFATALILFIIILILMMASAYLQNRYALRG
ncbi:phosphate ABC transporter permease subunit PstC [Methanobrevibacter sp.]|uniref:phosphate ABC transporter permease subunit PstC n=1 Tax=Methanobrevibacter sp. TaxID=66852 RepID=UPI0038908A48